MKAKHKKSYEDDKTKEEGLFINSNEKKAVAKINLFISTAINGLAELGIGLMVKNDYI